MTQDISPLILFYRALGDASRLKLLGILSLGPRCVDDLALALGVQQPKVSRHLAYLRQAGLVEADRSGRRVFYRVLLPRDRYTRSSLLALLRHLKHNASASRSGRPLGRRRS